MDRISVESAYEHAREQYAVLEIDVEAALASLSTVPLSLHCWQGDDVGGFERFGGELSGGGLQVTGACPGRARTPDELRADLAKARSLIPGRHRVNLHAMYGDFGGKPVDRDEVEREHFQDWADWAAAEQLSLDFNATCFSHARAASGFTLSHREAGIRQFWVEHVRRCRDIGAWLGQRQENAALHNLWIPDGEKDSPTDRFERRALLLQSLDEIYARSYDARELQDAIEGKLFGIGSEAFVVGSHEFYLCYALQRRLLPCLDLGHYHPTESVADKISALLPFFPALLVHVSRGLRWDSDHVVTVTDELNEVTAEIIRAGALPRVRLALDYFDGGMSRVGAWVIGARATLKSLLSALLQPSVRLTAADDAGDAFARLAWLEEAKTLPLGAVWDYYCLRAGTPAGSEMIAAVQSYHRIVSEARG